MHGMRYFLLVCILSLISLCQSFLVSIPPIPFRRLSLSAEANNGFSEDALAAAMSNTTENGFAVDQGVLQRLEDFGARRV